VTVGPRARFTLGLVTTLALAGAGFGPRPVRAADDAAAGLPAWLREVTLDGYLSATWGYNFNRPDSRTNQVRVFDFDDDAFKVDLFELVVQRPVSKPREAGFRMDLAFGSSVPRVSSSAGLFRDSTRTDDLDLHQAFLSWVAPVGSGLRLDLGKFITQHGYEVIDGYDGWNDEATRSFLFGYAIPFTHVGLRAGYVFSPRVSATALVVNGWDVARENNRSKSVGAQIACTPVGSLTVTVNGMAGAERAGVERDPRTLLDAVAIWKVHPRLTLGANADWGAERGAVAPGELARWRGYAGYARFVGSGGFALCLRAESFQDLAGARTGTAQRLREVTLTPELRLAPRLLLRLDGRVDRSDHDVFERGNAFTDTQPTVLVNALYAF
jgi:hypothetical protein